MRRIAHISDLHFGTEESAIADGLLADISGQLCHLLVVSGDLTQRARSHQFIAARAYLDRIPLPRIVVPGNHDIPLYNLFARFLQPLDGYRRHITADLTPTFHDAEVAVAGVNTSRPDRWKDGSISPEQIEQLASYFAAREPTGLKILTAHHPFIPPAREPAAAIVTGAAQALRRLEAVGCSLILSGHLHHAYLGDAKAHHVEMERSTLVIQAGTAISRRRRGEANAYNLLTVEGHRLTVEVRSWDGAAFGPSAVHRYVQAETGWRPGAPAAATGH
jgi:3',5'-cyclic AMP phosphodiesterase CpdA